MGRLRQALLVAVIALLLVASAAALALAQETRLGGKVRAGDRVTIPASEVVRSDLYTFAGTIVVDGTVEGDLIAFGGQIDVNGTVGGDVIAAGGVIGIGGRVGGDVRAASGQLTVSGQAAEDVLVAAGQFSLSSAGRVGGDVILSVGQATLEGPVGGGIAGNAGSYARRGTIGGSEEVEVGESTAAPAPAPPTPTDRVVDAVQHFIAVVFFGGLGLWLFPRAMRAAAGALQGRPLVSVVGGLLGLVGFIVVVIAAVVLMILLAIALGAVRLESLVAVDVLAGLLAIFGAMLAFALIVAFLVDALVGLALARILRPALEGDRWQEFALLAAGAAVVVIATSLPVVGGWIKLLVVLAGLGGLGLAILNWRSRSATPAVTPAGGPS